MNLFLLVIFLFFIPSVLSIGIYPQEIRLEDSNVLFLSSSKNSSIFLESDVLDVPERLQIEKGITKLSLRYKKKRGGSLLIKEDGIDLLIPVVVEHSFKGIYIFLIINFIGFLLGGIMWKKKLFFQ